mgnify:CR=1 FL=1
MRTVNWEFHQQSNRRDGLPGKWELRPIGETSHVVNNSLTRSRIIGRYMVGEQTLNIRSEMARTLTGIRLYKSDLPLPGELSIGDTANKVRLHYYMTILPLWRNAQMSRSLQKQAATHLALLITAHMIRITIRLRCHKNLRDHILSVHLRSFLQQPISLTPHPLARRL